MAAINIPSAWSASDTLGASELNTYVRDNMTTISAIFPRNYTVAISLLDADSPVTVVNGIASARLFIPPLVNGFVLSDADACVITASTSGTPTFQIRNVTDSVDILSTRITIDANEKTSYTAATQPVINTSNDDVATGDELRFDCDVAGTGTTGLTIILVFAEA